jgi:probable F420-dependent oxidoreductase
MLERVSPAGDTAPAAVIPGANVTRHGFLTGSWPLGLPTEGSFYRELARAVEDQGFDFLFSGDHLFMYNPNVDALVLLAAYGGATRRLLLGTGVLLPALREPVVTAKQLASIDYLTGGRLIVGVGVGGEIEAEWRAMQVPREQRGARTDEALDLMRAFWSDEPLEFDGRFRQVHGVTGSPATATAGGPPIWIGGRSDKALERAARFDGWCAYSCSLGRMRRSIDAIGELRRGDMSDYRISYLIFTYVADSHEQAREMAARVLGRRYHQDFEHLLDALCAVGTPEHVAERLAAYREAGVQDFLFVPQCPWQEYGEQVQRMAEIIGTDRAVPEAKEARHE